MEKKLDLVQGDITYNLSIPDNVERKIRHLCGIVHDIEWSGILFYTTKGSFENNDFSITCLDIFVMDVGDTGFTTFPDTSDIAHYRAYHPELLAENVYEGLIHSHNNMKTFFSGTDSATLVQEGTEQNHFLSLIVNNEGTYTAKITRKVNEKMSVHTVTSGEKTKEYLTYNDKPVIIESTIIPEEVKDEVKNKQYIECFNLNIDKENVNTEFDELNVRLSSMLTKKPKAKIKKTYSDYKWDTPINTYPNTSLWSKSTFDKNSALSSESLAFKILTGSILASPGSKSNMKDWAKCVDDNYKRTFGYFTANDNDETWSSIKLWIEQIIEFVVNEFIKYEEYTIAYKETILAIIDHLEKLKSKSKIVEYMIDTLKLYAYDDYFLNNDESWNYNA